MKTNRKSNDREKAVESLKKSFDKNKKIAEEQEWQIRYVVLGLYWFGALQDSRLLEPHENGEDYKFMDVTVIKAGQYQPEYTIFFLVEKEQKINLFNNNITLRTITIKNA